MTFIPDIPDAEVLHYLDNTIELSLVVPPSPTVHDIAVSYRNQLQRQLETAEESVFDAELAVANAQRIALAARSRVVSLHGQIKKLNDQIAGLT